jgi:restriction system protein
MSRIYYSPRRKKYAYSFIPSSFLTAAGILAVLYVYGSPFSQKEVFLFGGLIVSILILALIILIWFAKRKIEEMRYLQLVDIDNMKGHDFEKYIGVLLRDLGYQVDHTRLSGDFGADLILKKEGQCIAAQLKRYRGLVGIEAIYQAVGSKAYYHCENAAVITNSYFTSAAKKSAKVNNCWLVDRDDLKKWIIEFQRKAAKNRSHSDTTPAQ